MAQKSLEFLSRGAGFAFLLNAAAAHGIEERGDGVYIRSAEQAREPGNGINGVAITAIVTSDERKAAGDFSHVKVNLGGELKGVGMEGITVYPDYETALREQKFDAVMANVPTDMHEESSIAALEAGCNLFCEKPLAITLASGRRMVEASESAADQGLHAMIAQCINRTEEYMILEKAVKEGAIGDIQCGELQELDYYRHAKRPPLRKQTRDGKLNPYGAMDVGIHCIGHVIAACGKPNQVSAKGGNRGISSHDAPDLVDATYSFRGKPYDGKVTTHCSWNHNYNYKFKAGFKARFENGTLELSQGQLNYTPKGQKIAQVIEPVSQFPVGYDMQLHQFAQSILQGKDATGEQDYCKLNEGLDAMKVCWAIRNSIADGGKYKRVA